MSNTTQWRKRLLIAESNLNRAHLVDDLDACHRNIERRITENRNIFALCSLGAQVAVTWFVPSNKASKPKPSGMRVVTDGALGLLSWWQSLKPR
ncbi:MAG: hypothetical protein EA402_13935 [Planctomycetota bacterium]|nr:MAG: hypothetical protein EA402_13935 [Planctomycetota bacterium]